MSVRIDKAIRIAEKKYSTAERMRDREWVMGEIRRLDSIGVKRETIAELMHMTPRNIERIVGGQVRDVKAPKMHTYNKRAEHANKLERTAEATLELACRLRDEDPGFVYDVGQNLDRQSLIEMWMVALAAMPIDLPKSEVFRWVEEMGAEQ